jgi:hypothetical protein
MKKMAFSTLVLVLFGVSACVATVGIGRGTSIPEDATTRCEKHCGTIGLELSAVAIMANNLGCICERTVPTEARGASAAAGMVTLMLQEEERQRQQHQHHH